jgi:hypothetical protein
VLSAGRGVRGGAYFARPAPPFIIDSTELWGRALGELERTLEELESRERVAKEHAVGDAEELQPLKREMLL